MNSAKWRCWIAVRDLYTCKYCRDSHGKVFGIDEPIYDKSPVHERCRGTIECLKTIGAGFATRSGEDGADYWLKWRHTLPNYYITKEEAKALGWKAILGNLSDVAPEKMIGGDLYKTEMAIFLRHLDEFGTKRISILPMDTAQDIVFFTPSMA